jgi:prepilin peptidase CpaA
MSAMTAFELPVSWLMVPLFVAVIVYDLRFMRIPNRLVLLVCVIIAVSLPFSVPLAEIGWRLVAAAVVFVLAVTLFALRLMGGGDVKLLTALTLLIPTQSLAVFALLLSVGIFVGIAGLYLLRRATRGLSTNWRSLQDHSRYPLGLSIGLSGLAFAMFGANLTAMI